LQKKGGWADFNQSEWISSASGFYVKKTDVVDLNSDNKYLPPTFTQNDAILLLSENVQLLDRNSKPVE